VLGVRGTDDAASIRKRYHMLARKYHPDKVAAAGGGGGGGASSDNDAHTATAKFQKIAAAYELISAL
jgi:DnaJ-class molecular chaperone